jgi:shikimate dehydrogenase
MLALLAMSRFGVVGDPISHSKSPAMHRAAYAALGLGHTYEKILATSDELPSVVAQLRAGELAGLNVTVPHKVRVLDLVDEAASTASTIGAANTLVREPSGKIVAHNTDVPALLEEIAALRPRAGGHAIVLGTGGAGKAALFAVLASSRAAEVHVRARTPVGSSRPLAPDPAVERKVSIVLQATSCGMIGADPGEIVANAVAWDALPDDAVALDVVYSPLETPFLAAARARGLRCANGLGMLARQGALAFELWLGIPAPLDAMRAAL